MKLVLLLFTIFIQACVYTVKPIHYSNISTLIESINEHTHPITSMKALASVSLDVNNRRAEFPEGIIMNNNALRLETLNIFYQPVLIIIYNGSVAILDVNSGVCSISSEDALHYYTQLHVPPDVFKKLITGQLIGTPITFSSTGRNLIVSGKYERLAWFTTLNDALSVKSTTIISDTEEPLVCDYDGHSIVAGAVLPEYILCKWGENSLKIHYTKAQINIPVESSLMDIDRLCE
ncbi:MAG: hypothetical protein ACP5JP_08970 [bacterium]